jgi:hypothetical protein
MKSVVGPKPPTLERAFGADRRRMVVMGQTQKPRAEHIGSAGQTKADMDAALRIRVGTIDRVARVANIVNAPFEFAGKSGRQRRYPGRHFLTNEDENQMLDPLEKIQRFRERK